MTTASLRTESTSTRSPRTDASARELVITRIFDAPRSLVFKLWTDPQLAKYWVGPRGFTATHVEYDLPGRAWRMCLHPDDGGEDLWQGGVTVEVVENERLVYTFAWEHDGERGHETLVTVTFTEHAGKTTMIFRQAYFENVEQRDGHQAGWTSTFDRLEAYLARITS